MTDLPFSERALVSIPHQLVEHLVYQSMMEQPSTEVDGGRVLQTMQAGYALFGRTVRPAMVVVAAKGSGAQASASDQVAAAAAYVKAVDGG